MILTLLAGCVQLDSFLFNPVHCTTVGPETCEAPADPWDRVCKVCEEPYDWQRTYDWMPGTLTEGQDPPRPVPEASVTALSIETEDGEGTLDAYFLASHGEDPVNAGVTLVYNHGRYAGIEHYQPRVRFLYEAGYNVLVWDYRGFGKSQPDTVPTADQHLADARTVMTQALALAPDPDRVAVYGYSAGSVSATEMALDPHTCALVLEAPFASIARSTEAGTGLSLGEQFLTSGQLDNFERMALYAGPVLGMIGTEDETVPGVDNATELTEAGSGPSEVWVVEGASHGIGGGGIPEDAGLTVYLDRVNGFVQAHCGP